MVERSAPSLDRAERRPSVAQAPLHRRGAAATASASGSRGERLWAGSCIIIPPRSNAVTGIWADWRAPAEKRVVGVCATRSWPSLSNDPKGLVYLLKSFPSLELDLNRQ
jgi:hypothetical protein